MRLQDDHILHKIALNRLRDEVDNEGWEDEAKKAPSSGSSDPGEPLSDISSDLERELLGEFSDSEGGETAAEETGEEQAEGPELSDGYSEGHPEPMSPARRRLAHPGKRMMARLRAQAQADTPPPVPEVENEVVEAGLS